MTLPSPAYKQAIERSLAKHGFQRAKRAWRRKGPELIWIVEVTKSPSWRKDWGVDIGIQLVERDDATLTVNDCDIQVDYLFLGDRVPEASQTSRFDDHTSYFSMILNTDHDFVEDDERLRSLEFIGADLGAGAEQLSTIAHLRQALSDGAFEGAFVRPDLVDRLRIV